MAQRRERNIGSLMQSQAGGVLNGRIVGACVWLGGGQKGSGILPEEGKKVWFVRCCGGPIKRGNCSVRLAVSEFIF